MQKIERIQRVSLITPKPTFQAGGGNEPEATTKKRGRSQFELSTYKILPDIPNIVDQSNTNFALNPQAYEKEQILIKVDKELDKRSQNLQDMIKSRSEKMVKYKTITQNIDTYIELDEKIVDIKNLKDETATNDGTLTSLIFSHRI